jgi:hypothetical protein
MSNFSWWNSKSPNLSRLGSRRLHGGLATLHAWCILYYIYYIIYIIIIVSHDLMLALPTKYRELSKICTGPWMLSGQRYSAWKRMVKAPWNCRPAKIQKPQWYYPRLIKHDLLETTSFENPTKTSDFRPSQGANLPRPSYPIDLLKGSQQK